MSIIKDKSGVEFTFDKELRGEPTKVKYVRDAKGRAVKVQRESEQNINPEIVLSIDKDIQGFAEKVLKETIQKYNAQGGGVGVMDVESGEILAMANFPDYDPNFIKKKMFLI